jgi:hypothetical protein
LWELFFHPIRILPPAGHKTQGIPALLDSIIIYLLFPSVPNSQNIKDMMAMTPVKIDMVGIIGGGING